MAKFVHLHVHSEYSLLDGLCRLPDLIARTKELGMDTVALTDHGAMYGVIPFYLAARQEGIKPVIGVEAYMAQRSRFDKQPKIDADQYHLVLLAKNEKGYKNLMKLVTLAHLEGFYYKPRVDFELLSSYKEGLIALTSCLSGEIPNLILQGKTAQAEKRARGFQELFGDDFYLELQAHPKMSEQEKANKGLVKLSRKLGIPLVATNDVHYLLPEDAEAQDALLAIQTQKKITDKDRLTMVNSPDFYLRSPEEMSKLFRQYPDACKNTLKIAKACNVEIETGEWILPHFPLPQGKTAGEYLRQRAKESAKRRFKRRFSKEVRQRLDYELDIICKKGFATYFLIVTDFVNWAKDQGVRVGPGRGSVAGSLVSYVLRITSINPLEHNLPFERFMNPARPTPPDIDLDFADDRRDEVIEYVTEKYGRDKVAQIITFGRMEARMAVRDVARVLGFPYATGDRIAKMIPSGSQGFPMTIDRALAASPELKNAYEEEETKKILDLAKKLAGVARQASTHAAGVVIADRELTEYVPLQWDSHKEKVITQYDMYALDLNASEEAIGLLKIDFLGLRNLTILAKAAEFVKATQGKQIDVSEIPLDDPQVYQMICRGETTGVFQLESAGMRRLARNLKPEKFSDIAAMVALFRPGPMQWIDDFVAGKTDPLQVHYLHPDLKPILEETYGIAVYQEQCLEIAVSLAGYTWAEADSLRRAIGKKKRSLMAKERTKFIKKAVEKGYTQRQAEDIFYLIERFVGYGFNKAHSTSYAMIAYQTAWMKANFPVEFMAAVLTAESGNADKVALGVEECRRMGITILPPDINVSQAGFVIEKEKGSLERKAIRFGLAAIKNVGVAAIEAIISARELGGDFASLTDFCHRVDTQKVNKKVLESLIKAGALDRFGGRAAMLAGLDQARSRAEREQRRKASGQTSLFEQGKKEKGLNPADDLPEIEEFSKNELMSFERALFGFYLSEHPLTSSLPLLEAEVTHKLYQVTSDLGVGEKVRVGGILSQLRVVLTKNGAKEMAFGTIEDETGRVELVVFPGTFASTRSCWVKDQVVICEGKLESREENLSLIVSEALSLSSVSQKPKFDFTIRIPKGTSSKDLVKLNQYLKKSPGDKKGVLVFEGNGVPPKKLVLSFGVDYSKELKEKIRELFKRKTS